MSSYAHSPNIIFSTKIVTSAAIVTTVALTMIGSSVIAPAPAQAASAQDFVNAFDVLRRFVIDLAQTTFRGSEAAIPNPQPDDIPTPDDTEEVESN